VSSEECEYIVTTLEPRFARILPTRGAAHDLYSVFVVRVTYRERTAYDQVSFYEAIGGLDGSTTLQALAKCRASFIGKCYMLGSDFKIQADRDYPIEGLNEFSLFGQVNLVGVHTCQ
jgi:hypothetical protein